MLFANSHNETIRIIENSIEYTANSNVFMCIAALYLVFDYPCVLVLYLKETHLPISYLDQCPQYVCRTPQCGA